MNAGFLPQEEVYPGTTTGMAPPQFLLDALSDSITSGTFIDTKFHVFTRRDASGRVYAPRALYCNSRVLDTVPYFSSCTWLSSGSGVTNPPTLKCSRTDFLKDKRRTSGVDSPLSSAPTPRTTTTCLTVTLRTEKMNLMKQLTLGTTGHLLPH